MLKAFVFLATVYTSNGPAVYVLDDGLTGADCIARMEGGVTAADAQAVAEERIGAMGEGHVPSVPADLTYSVLSCEFDMGDD